MSTLRTFIFLTLLLPVLAIGQQPSFFHYGVNEGLPSSEVYQTIQDGRGALWIATDKGISRFDGQQFFNFSVQNGLPGNVVFWIQADSKNRIWFLCANGSMGFIVEDKVHVITQLDHDPINGAGFIVHGDTAYVSVSAKQPYILKVAQDGTMLKMPIVPSTVPTFFVFELFPDKFLKFSNLWVFEAHKERQYFEKRHGKEPKTVAWEEGIYNNLPYGRMGSSGPVSFVTFQHRLLVIDNGKIAREEALSHGSSNFIFSTPDGLVWLGTHNKGVLCLDTKNNYSQTQWLDGYSVSHISSDHEGGMWFCTLEDGLFYLPHPNIQTYPVGRINFLRKGEGKCIVGYRNQQLALFDSGQLGVPTTSPGRFRDLLHGPNGWLLSLLTNSQTPLKLADDTQVDISSNSYNLLAQDEQHLLWSAGSGGLYCYRKSWDRLIDSLTIRSFSIGKDGHKYLGSSRGLYVYDLDSNLRSIPLNPVEQQISAVFSTRDRVYTAGKGYGISVLNYQDEFLEVLTEKNGLTSNFINVIYVSGDTLWAGTNRGLCMVINCGDSKMRQHYRFTHRDGLLSDDITTLMVEHQSVYIGTSKGLNVIDRKALFANPIAPQLHLTTGDNHHKPDSAGVVFQSNQLLQFNFNGVAFRYGNSLQYEYRLQPRDESWTLTGDQQVSFQDLAPGDYQFQVRALTPNASSEILSVVVVVLPAFWQTWWFIALLGLAGIGLIALIFRYRENRIRAMSANENLQLRLTHQALSAQMSPHFIFNSLGSIQRLVMEKLNMEAITYLAGFGRLMRQILHHSDHLFVPFDKEIALINEYVSLERLRFEREFDFEWEIDISQPTDQISLPSMLLQPLIENAIHHGILPLKQQGKITICVKEQKDHTLMIEIIDNGQGIATSGFASKKTEHQSKGIGLLENRLHVFRQLFKQQAAITVLNRADSEPKTQGTHVRLIVPFQAVTE